MNRSAFIASYISLMWLCALAIAPLFASPIDSPLPTPTPEFDPHPTYDVYIDCVNWSVIGTKIYPWQGNDYAGEDVRVENMIGTWLLGQIVAMWEHEVRWWFEGSIVISHDGGIIERPCVAWVPVVTR